MRKIAAEASENAAQAGGGKLPFSSLQPAEMTLAHTGGCGDLGERALSTRSQPAKSLTEAMRKRCVAGAKGLRRMRPAIPETFLG